MGILNAVYSGSPRRFHQRRSAVTPHHAVHDESTRRARDPPPPTIESSHRCAGTHNLRTSTSTSAAPVYRIPACRIGKSSLSFARCTPRAASYVESLSAYSRHFCSLEKPTRPDEGFSLHLDRRRHQPQSASTVARSPRQRLPSVLYAAWRPYCPPSRAEAVSDDERADVDATLALTSTPAVDPRSGSSIAGDTRKLLIELRAQGFVRVRVDGTVYEIDAAPKLKEPSHDEVPVRPLKVDPNSSSVLLIVETARATATAAASRPRWTRRGPCSPPFRVRSETTLRGSRATAFLVQQSGRRSRAATALGSISVFDPIGSSVSAAVARVRLSKGWTAQPFISICGRSRQAPHSTSITVREAPSSFRTSSSTLVLRNHSHPSAVGGRY